MDECVNSLCGWRAVTAVQEDQERDEASGNEGSNEGEIISSRYSRGSASNAWLGAPHEWVLPGHQPPPSAPAACRLLLLCWAAAELPRCQLRLLRRLCHASRLVARSSQPDQQQSTCAARLPPYLLCAPQAKPWVR